MTKAILKWTVTLLIGLNLASCSSNTESTSNQVEARQTKSIAKSASSLGNFNLLVGKWTVDAKTAGLKMDLTFVEDGSFRQSMGQVNGVGTWEILDDKHINIVTQNTKGQKWRITGLTEDSVNISWNPDKPNSKTIPMQRVK